MGNLCCWYADVLKSTLNVTLIWFSFVRGSTIQLACTRPHPGRLRHQVSTNATPTSTFIARQSPAHPSRPEKTADSPVSRCEYTYLDVGSGWPTLTGNLSHGHIDRRAHKPNVPFLHRTSPRPYRHPLGRCTIPCLVHHPRSVRPLGFRQALRRRRLRPPLLHTMEDIPLHSVVRVFVAIEWTGCL